MSKEKKQDAVAGDDIDMIAKVALDSADVANRSARAAAHTASKLADVTARFDRALAQQRKQMIIIISISGVIALLAFAMFIASAIQLRGRVAQVNTVLTMVATRALELRQGLDQIPPLAERVEGFAGEVATASRLQRDLQSSIQRLDKILAERAAPPPAPVVVAPAPAPAPAPAVQPAQPAQKPQPPAPKAQPNGESPEQVAAREKLIRQTLESVQAVAAQARSLEANLRAQATALNGVATRVAAIEQGVAKLPAMQSDLKVLLSNDQTRAAVVEKISAERRREEALRQERERFVQFPAPSGAQSGAVPAQVR